MVMPMLMVLVIFAGLPLVSLRGAWGWSLLGVVWSLALLGIVQEIWLAKGARVLSLVIYVLMGIWLIGVVGFWRFLTGRDND